MFARIKMKFPLTFLPFAVREAGSFASSDGMFKLQWTYGSGKLNFNMMCKATGWCAVGFTKSADGKGMRDYDIVVAGLAANQGYINVSLT